MNEFLKLLFKIRELEKLVLSKMLEKSFISESKFVSVPDFLFRSKRVRPLSPLHKLTWIRYNGGSHGGKPRPVFFSGFRKHNGVVYGYGICGISGEVRSFRQDRIR